MQDDEALPAGFKIPRAGSRKHEVWLEFRRAGREAATIKAIELQIKESSCKAWLSDWQMAARGQLPAWMRKSVSLNKACIRRPSTNAEAMPVSDDAGNEIVPSFAYEYQLRDFLAWNLNAIEIGDRR